MYRKIELVALVLTDALMIASAYGLHYLARFRWGWYDAPVSEPPVLLLPTLLICLFWILLFFFSGLYRERYAESRLDELVSLLKVVSLGILILFFALYIRNLDPGSAQQIIAFYWASTLGLVALGRVAVRTIQKAFRLRGYGLRRALVVGWSDQVDDLRREVDRYPEAGLKVVGTVRLEPKRSLERAPLMTGFGGGSTLVEATVKADTAVHMDVEALPALIDRADAQEVLLALESEDQDALLDVLRVCDGRQVRLKLVPDFYHVVAGMARTEHLYGLPLIEVLTVPMPPWEQSTKRLIDLIVSSAILLLGLPLWLGIGLLVRLSSPGPSIYRQVRVGRHGARFTMYKFRTMRADAERETGPVWATENDPRYTAIGRWLRKTRIDEVPQFWNVLKGEMSIVGPRPERPYFVDRLVREIPLYNRRHRVKPGITGLAQVKWKYDASVEDVRQKVKYDLFYIENMSLRMDFKILFHTLRAALLGEGQ